MQYRKKLKEKQQTLSKYLLKNERQENLMTYFFNHVMLCTNKTQQRNEGKIKSHPSPRMATSESLKSTEV